jgi:hypothetical protein
MSHSRSTISTPSSLACEPAARSSLARWSATKTAIGSATSAARRGSSSSWRSRSAEGLPNGTICTPVGFPLRRRQRPTVFRRGPLPARGSFFAWRCQRSSRAACLFERRPAYSLGVAASHSRTRLIGACSTAALPSPLRTEPAFLRGKAVAGHRLPSSAQMGWAVLLAVIAGLDDSGFVGGDDGLYPVAAAQLHQDVADVSNDRSFMP